VLACLLLACAEAVHADELVGRLTGCDWLGGDAPENDQPFGDRLKQDVAQLTHGRDGRANCPKRVPFERQICKVWVQRPDCRTLGLTLDVGLAQISAGLAW
jgi:hypothetical protein